MQLFRIKRNADRRNGRSWSVDGWQIFYPGGAGAYRNRSYFIPDAGRQRSDEGRIFTAEDGKRSNTLALMVVSSIRVWSEAGKRPGGEARLKSCMAKISQMKSGRTDRHFRAIRFWFRTRRCLDRMFPKSWMQFVKICSSRRVRSVLSKLDDLMWLLNIRGADVECNPVALSYAYLTQDECHFFLQDGEVTVC